MVPLGVSAPLLELARAAVRDADPADAGAGPDREAGPAARAAQQGELRAIERADGATGPAGRGPARCADSRGGRTPLGRRGSTAISVYRRAAGILVEVRHAAAGIAGLSQEYVVSGFSRTHHLVRLGRRTHHLVRLKPDTTYSPE